MATNFNITPYFDDFDELKQYYKVLFRPGVAVQTREMNQLQSILQNQISKVGDHLFKEGSMVIPGQVNYNDKLNYIKISAANIGIDITDQTALSDALEDHFLIDNINGTGVKARVIKAIAATSAGDPLTLVLLYTQSSEAPESNTNIKTFAASSTLYLEDNTTFFLTVSAGTGISGRSVVAGVQTGIYYLAGHFVTVPEQTISVKKYADTVLDINAKIGLQYTESIVTAADDSSLYDNAAGSPNFAAPGAHRYKIDARLVQLDLDDNPENFFELLRVEEGTLQSIINASQYNILEETLARRTFEESGNYVVDDFKFDVREDRKNDRGTWSQTTNYEVNDFVLNNAGTKYFVCLQTGTSGTVEPSLFGASSTNESTGAIADSATQWRYVDRPVSNRGLNLNGSSSNLVATFGIGKAYVQGFEIGKTSNSNITIPKARDTLTINNSSIPLNQGNYIFLNKTFTYGIPDISTGPAVILYDRQIAATSTKFAQGQIVGTARINWTEPDARGGIRVGLSDIRMRLNKSFDRDCNSIVVPSPTTSNVTATNYTATSLIKYAGGSTSSFLAISGSINTSSQAALTMIVSGTNTRFASEFIVGDFFTLGTSSHATTSSWQVTQIVSETTMIVTGSPFAATVGSAALVRLQAGTVFGHATGVGTRFQSEFRVGDTVWLGTAGPSTTGTVLSIQTENRMVVSSAVNRYIAQTSLGLYYSGRSALFCGDVWDNYQLGINARKLTGLFTLQDYSGGTTVVQASNGLKITGSNDAKLFSELRTNDYVDINNNRIYITKVSSNSVAYGISLDGTITGATTQYPAFKVTNNLNSTEINTLLFPIASATSSIVDNLFTVYKTQNITGLTGLSSVTVTLASASGNAGAESLATTDPSAFFVAADTLTSLSGPVTVNNVTVVGQNVTINTLSTFSSTSVRVIYPVVRSAANNNVLGRVKTKTLIFNAFDTYLTSSAATQINLRLSNSDIHRLVKVYMATSFVGSWTAATQSNAVDVTNRYDLDAGQRDTYYDVGTLKRKNGAALPTGSIRVFYDYFQHGSGDFFSKESYNPIYVPYENIPTYKNVSLGDVIDFRARISTSNGTLVNAAPPRFGTYFNADVTFYLGRKEKIFLDRNGSFYNVSGVSDVKPELPKASESNNSINLYNLELQPYTKTSEFPDVSTTTFDNRRYTMRDIGRIEKRVTNLEEITSLSLLETKTQSLQIRDNLDSTLERYKTGFFVDNFSDASNADVNNDTKFSIDSNGRTLYPSVEYYSFPLVEKINYTTATVTTATELLAARVARESENYTITGDLLTLKYTTSTMAQQIIATTSISVAPFLTATFLGSLRIIPDSDIYENVTTVNRVVGESSNLTAANLAAAIETYRSTNNWRPYRIETESLNVFLNSDRTSTLIPFCRANTILWVGKGLKPNTKFYPYFDDVLVNDYMTGAIKMTFDSMPFIETDSVRPSTKTQWPRHRSNHESRNVEEVVRSRWVQFNRRSFGWVYDYGWFRRTLRPKNVEHHLPSEANRDAFKISFGIGTAVYYYESGRVVGSAVAVHQDATTLFMVNARGKLSPSFLRSQTSGTYNYNGVFYIGTEGKDPKFLPNPQVQASTACTSDTNGYVYTDSKGTVCAVFDLPDTDTVKFLTGKKPVVLTDDPNNHPDNWTSRAETVYTCEGFAVTIYNNYITTKNYVARPYDPIAQSFKIPTQYQNGAFVTDIDIFFQSKPLVEQLPVQLELRTCDSTGRPSTTELVPGTEVTKWPSDINIDATKAQVATKFTFRQPVYLLPQKNYAIVLKSDTKNYRVWIATLGQTDVNTPTSSYTTQATLGSFFKSQDGTLWTEDQLSDLKFKISRAVFTTADSGARVHVVNRNIENNQLPNNPFTFVHGTNKIRVGHKNHGMTIGDQTRFYSSSYAAQYQANSSINGIPLGEIFGSYISSDITLYRPSASDPKLTISDAQLDTYTITVSSIANLGATAVTGVTAVVQGGEDIFAPSNVLYHVIKPSANILGFEPTTLTMQGKMLQAFTYDTGVSPNPYNWIVKDLNFNTQNILDTSCIILTDVNEATRVTTSIAITAGGTSQVWTDSFIGIITLKTTNDAVSPAIDLSTFYLDTIQHRIDNPSVYNRLPAVLPPFTSSGAIQSATSYALLIVNTIAQSSTTISFDGSSSQTISTTTEGLFNSVVPGRYITISGSTTVGNTYTSTGLLVTSVDPDGNSFTVSGTLTTAEAGPGIWIWQWDDFTEEATSGTGSGESKFIIKQVNLKNPASQIKLIVEACVPNAADFDVYYKTGSVGSDFDNLVWKRYVAPNQPNQMSSYATIVKSDTRNVFTDVEFNISNYDSQGSVVELEPFTAFQVKLVMRSSNAARVPQFRNLRVIAHA